MAEGDQYVRASFRSALANREFRALWAADLLSIVGDQFARVALSLLVYDRTGSALFTGLAFAATYLPTMIGGLTLGWLADRFDRRGVMIVVDLVRAAMAALMAIPGSPVGAVIAPVVVISLLHPVFRGAQMATLRAVLSDPALFKMGSSLRTVTLQAGQVLGFAAGGSVVGLTSPSVALLIDAATFVASSALLLSLRKRPVERGGARRSPLNGITIVLGDRRLRALIGVQALVGCYVASEAVAAPYAKAIGGGAGATGLLLAAPAVGAVAGAYVAGWLRDRDSAALGPLVFVTGLPLLVCLALPGLWVSLLLFALTGVALTATVVISTNLATLHAEEKVRGHVMSAFNAVLMTTQGVGAAAGGWLASTRLGPAAAISVLAAAGMVCAVAVGISWRRAERLGSSLLPVHGDSSREDDRRIP